MNTRMIAPALAFTALVGAQAAQAQQQACVHSADLADAVVYAMPIAYDAARTTCANRFSKRGFMATRGESYIAPFRAGQTKAWPGAFRFLKTFMAKEAAGEAGSDADMAAMISAMPEESLRPFVDALVGQMIAGEIKGDDCSKIERGAELLSPLPTENVGGLVAFLAELTGLDNPPICTAANTAPAASRK